MAAAPAPNSRASLLAGLRTGGVRSVSGPLGSIPHTAAPTGTFTISRHHSAMHNGSLYTTEEEDELADMLSQNLYINLNRVQPPMTAAVDGTANRFAQQQHMPVPMSPFIAPPSQAQLQAIQLQMMQAEIVRLQALQAQQYHQAELLAQAQRQRQPPQQPPRRSTFGVAPPATAGPTQGSFDLRAVAAASQVRRAPQIDQLRSKLGIAGEDQVPMTAALNGKFGVRTGFTSYDMAEDELSLNAKSTTTTFNNTTVISGGTPLGTPTSNNNVVGAQVPPSKSDVAVSWRRSDTNNSMLKGRTPLVKVTPPPSERVSPPPSISPVKTRPHPLTFTIGTPEPLTSTVIVTSEGTDGDDSSSVSSRSGSSPSTPCSSSSIGEMPPLSPREEASKKLYEGLGIGRPVPTAAIPAPALPVQRPISQFVRQPRGPPSNNDELVPKNFATRSRRKAIGALLDARERREVIEAY